MAAIAGVMMLFETLTNRPKRELAKMGIAMVILRRAMIGITILLGG